MIFNSTLIMVLFLILFGLAVAIFVVMVGDQINEFEFRFNDPSDVLIDINGFWHLSSKRWARDVNLIHKLDRLYSGDYLLIFFKDTSKIQQELLKNILQYHSFLANHHNAFVKDSLRNSLKLLKRSCYAELFGGLMIAFGLMIAGIDGSQWVKLLVLVLLPLIFLVLDVVRTQANKMVLNDMTSPIDILLADLDEDDPVREILIGFKHLKLQLPQSDRLELKSRLHYAQELVKTKSEIDDLINLLSLIQTVNNQEVDNTEFNSRLGNFLDLRLSSTSLLSELSLAFQQLSRASLLESAILADDDDEDAKVLRNRLLKSFEDLKHALILVAKDSLKLTQFNADTVIQQLIINGDMDKMDNKVLMSYFVKLGNQQANLK